MPSPSTHLRAPLLWILGPFMAGLVVAKLYAPPALGLGWLAAVAALAAGGAIAFAFSRQRLAGPAWATALTVAAGLAGFCLLSARYPHLHASDARPIREVTVTVEPFQIFPPAHDARSLTGLGKIIATDEFETELVGRRIYFSTIRRIGVEPRRGGHYVLTGVIEPMPTGTIDDGFGVYLENLGIRHRLTRAHAEAEIVPPGAFRNFCTQAQDHLEKILRYGVNPRHASTTSLYLAMLLGEKANLSEEQEAAFMRSGTFHIFSISGLHVGVIALALHGVLQFIRVPRRPAVVINLTLLWLYVQITGGSSPAERSFLMIAFLLGSQVLRLPGNGLAALVAAALVTLLIDPLQLFSTGFQMSYTVVIALVTMGAPLSETWLARWRPFAFLPKQDWRWPQHFIAWLGRRTIQASAVSWVAFLASTPAGIGYFHMLSLGALAANLVIIPLSSLAIIAGFVSLLTGLVGALWLSSLFNSAATVSLIVADWLTRKGTVLPGVYFEASFRAAWMTPAAMTLGTIVLLAGVGGGWRRRYGGYWPPVIAVGLMVIFGVKFGPP